MKSLIRIDSSGTHYILFGEEVTRAEYEEYFPPATRPGTAACLIRSRPHFSDGMSVHPEQIAEAMETDRKLGVPTEYSKDGRPLYLTREHQRRHLRAHGMFNKDGGYGD